MVGWFGWFDAGGWLCLVILEQDILELDIAVAETAVVDVAHASRKATEVMAGPWMFQRGLP